MPLSQEELDEIEYQMIEKADRKEKKNRTLPLTISSAESKLRYEGLYVALQEDNTMLITVHEGKISEHALKKKAFKITEPERITYIRDKITVLEKKHMKLLDR